ncbi:MAG: hypothetical protein EOO88_19435 [Pedobacter sp.]|nr:MAG: hypothetical protein EOO88_19435 [Pedobacter sp.]
MIAKILTDLYFGTSIKVFGILNQSIYITDIKKSDDTILFHTGFTFRSHKGTVFYILYDVHTGVLVRAHESKNTIYGKIPQLLGLLCPVDDSGFISHYYSSLVTSISSAYFDQADGAEAMDAVFGTGYTSGEIFNTKDLKVKNETVVLGDPRESVQELHNNFTLESNGNILVFPLYKTFPEIAFMSGNTISKYDPSLFSAPERQSADDWYRSEFGEDANSAWWNTH